MRNLIENFILLVELETDTAAQTYNWRKGPISDIESIIDDAIERVKQIGEEQHTLTKNIHAPLPLFLGDQEYLTVAIAQLLSNACKFSDDGTPISIEASAAQGRINICVKDRGRGIPAHELENIWKSFYQIDRTKNEDQGAGAGLAIVEKIVKLHGGTTTVESKEDDGSTFKISIPAVDLE